jgi:hypothetical protein
MYGLDTDEAPGYNSPAQTLWTRIDVIKREAGKRGATDGSLPDFPFTEVRPGFKFVFSEDRGEGQSSVGDDYSD